MEKAFLGNHLSEQPNVLTIASFQNYIVPVGLAVPTLSLPVIQLAPSHSFCTPPSVAQEASRIATSKMLFKNLLLALCASSTVLALPLPLPDVGGDLCLGSSFSPTNCNSPGADSINLDPSLDLSPTIDVRAAEPEPEPELDARSGNDCIGSSFSPTNCNSPGADSINVDPSVTISPTVDASGVTDAVVAVVSGVSHVVDDVTGVVTDVVDDTTDIATDASL